MVHNLGGWYGALSRVDKENRWSNVPPFVLHMLSLVSMPHVLVIVSELCSLINDPFCCWVQSAWSCMFTLVPKTRRNSGIMPWFSLAPARRRCKIVVWVLRGLCSCEWMGQSNIPRHLDCAIVSMQLIDTMHNSWDLHFTIIGRESACYNTLELFATLSSALYSIMC